MTQTSPVYCSDFSREAGEPLIGSAKPTSRYLLLEYNAVWGAKALEESDLPEAVKQHAGGFAKRDQAAKTLLIHRPQAEASPERLHLFLVSADEGMQAIFAFELERYERALELDFEAILRDPERWQAFRRKEPLLLVCVNGRRDPCCARRGMQVYQALEQAHAGSSPPLVWQSTHLGGHRFAANLLVLPHGLLYGRADDGSASQILESALGGQVYLPNLRGRVAYPPPAQAAERYLRQVSGRHELEAFRLEEVQAMGEEAWRVVFRELSTGARRCVEVQAEENGEEVYDSCKLDKMAEVVRYVVSRAESTHR